MTKIIKENLNLIYCEGEKEGRKIFFKIWNFGDKLEVQDIEKMLNESQLSNYCNKTLDQYLNEYTVFEVDKFCKELKPLNTSIYDYELFYNKKDIPTFWRSAFITQEENYFYIAVENYDEESMINRNNLYAIENYYNYSNLEKILNKSFSHVECYSY